MQTADFRKLFLILSLSLFTSFCVSEQQPDTTAKVITRPVHLQAGSTYNSFPSGHTTTAFVGAEFMNQEFGWPFALV
jgi:membrane-associated phospholipid phosphatase